MNRPSFYKNGPIPASFSFTFIFSNKQFISTTNMWKMSIQCLVLGFEPMTFWLWVSSHNHLTRAPTRTDHLNKFFSARLRLARLEKESQQRDSEPRLHVRQHQDVPPGRHPHQQPLQQGHSDLQEGQNLFLQRGEANCHLLSLALC